MPTARRSFPALAVGPDGAVTVTVPVTNTGAVPGAEVVQLYVRDPVASRVRPNRELAGFARVELDPGQTKRVSFRLEASQLAFLDRQGHWKVEAGEIQVLVGAASRRHPGARLPSPSRPTAIPRVRSGRSGPEARVE